MVCNTKDTIKTIEERPALILGGVKTPFGALIYLFFLFLSFAGLKQLTGENSVLSLLKSQIFKITEFSKKQFRVAEKTTKKGYEAGYTVFFLLALVATFLLTFMFADGKIIWIVIALAVILFALGISTFLNYYSKDNEKRDKIISSLTGGIILGAGISLIALLIKWSSEWLTGDFIVDFVFMFTIIYVILASFIMIRVGWKKVGWKKAGVLKRGRGGEERKGEEERKRKGEEERKRKGERKGREKEEKRRKREEEEERRRRGEERDRDFALSLLKEKFKRK